MPETRERSALEVLRRLDDLAKEGHIVVMGPQDLTDPLWDDIEAVLRATPASDGGEVRERGYREALSTPAASEDVRERVIRDLEGAARLLEYDCGDPSHNQADVLLEAAALLRTPSGEGEVTYPCRQCGTPRTAAEGGTTFTVCDECWDRQYGRLAARRGEGGGE